MHVTDQQKRRLMMECQKTGKVGVSALRAGMDRKTARKYLKAGETIVVEGKEELKPEINDARPWRTHADIFEAHWPEVVERLKEAPELEAKALFDWLTETHAGAYEPGQMRTFQRRVRVWRALEGPDKETYFPQIHKAGRRLQTDFTSMNSLKIAICREPFDHEVCHCVLTYSNWEWGVICKSESFIALRKGIQTALYRLGHIPEEHWTDHSTAATHVIDRAHADTRVYNIRYEQLMAHYGIKPCTIEVGKPNQNGDVESLNGSLKRRVQQYLLLRGSRDFSSLEEYRRFLECVMEKGNRIKTKRLCEELDQMRVLQVDLLPDYEELECRVTSWSTIQAARHSYSVPSRLIGEKVLVRLFEDCVQVYYHGVHQVTMERLRGDTRHRINYRHIIGWLIRKPGAFRDYRYREDLFPTGMFRWAYTELSAQLSERVADLEYLRILHEAARTMESQINEALT